MSKGLLKGTLNNVCNGCTGFITLHFYNLSTTQENSSLVIFLCELYKLF